MRASTLPTGLGPTEQPTIKVWDPLVRVFHWSVVVAFAVAYLSGDESLALHVWSGYAVGGLVVLRILWGFIGPKHARFADFVCGPLASLRYLGDVVSRRARRHIGHSPAGAAMVMVLLVALVALVGSGLQLYAIEDNAGPLAGLTTAAPSLASASPSASGGADNAEVLGGDAGGEDFWEEIHETLANLILLLVVLHIGGVALASIIHRENLVRAMITGSKRAE